MGVLLLHALARAGLGLVFVLAGTQKLLDPAGAGRMLEELAVLPAAWPLTAMGPTAFAAVLGAVEASIGLALLLGALWARFSASQWPREAAVAALLLLLLFTYRMGPWSGLMAPDLALLGLVLLLVAAPRPHRGPHVRAARLVWTPPSVRPAPWQPLILRAGLAAALLWLGLHQPLLLPAHPLAGWLEPAAGVLLLVGLFTRPVAVVLAAALAMARLWPPQPLDLLWVKHLGFWVGLLALAAAGAGEWSLEAMLPRVRQWRRTVVGQRGEG